jgi:rubrerythrin
VVLTTLASNSLNTFGSVLTFAINLEDTARTFYENLSKMEEHSFPNELLKELIEGNRKRRELLERTRRESVVEMVLERISGLDRAEYLVDISYAPDKIKATPLEVAIELERRIGRFYSDSANKTKFLPEVSRTLERLARNSGEREARLRNL